MTFNQNIATKFTPIISFKFTILRWAQILLPVLENTTI